MKIAIRGAMVGILTNQSSLQTYPNSTAQFQLTNYSSAYLQLLRWPLKLCPALAYLRLFPSYRQHAANIAVSTAIISSSYNASQYWNVHQMQKLNIAKPPACQLPSCCFITHMVQQLLASGQGLGFATVLLCKEHSQGLTGRYGVPLMLPA